MRKVFFYLITATVIGMAGCQKDLDSYEILTTPAAGSDSVWTAGAAGPELTALHQNFMSTALHADSFEVSTGLTRTFSDGLRVIVPRLAVGSVAGSVASGRAKLEVLLLTKKGQFISYRRPTISNGYVLESGGVLQVKITSLQNGAALSLLPDKYITIRYSDAAPNQAMRLFSGNETANGGFNWVLNDSSMVQPFADTTNGNFVSGYQLASNKLNWINVDRFLDSATAKTRLVVSMPAAYTNVNTSVFIVYKNNNSALAISADAPNRIWRMDKLLSTKPVQIITISALKDGRKFLGVQEMASLGTNPFVEIKPALKSQADIQAFLNTL